MVLDKPSLTLDAFSQFEKHPACTAAPSFAVCASLTACEAPESEEARKPIDLVVVLDKSGSMGGQPLELCKETMEFLIRELSPQDKLSLVTYDTHVQTVFGLMKMDQKGKDMAASASSRIYSGSCTNLSGGLLEGISQLAPGNGSEADVKSVLLLTDGHANNGITDQQALVRCVEGAIGQVAGDVTLFTFGYGSNHNADLMRAISDAGKGVYYFVEAQDDIANAFGDCLGGLLSVAAQNVKLMVETPENVTIKQIHTKRKITVHAEGRRYEVDMGDLYAEEKRDLLVELTLPGGVSASDAAEGVASFELKYVDAFTGVFETATATAAVARPASISEGVDANPANLHVAEQYDRVITARAIEEAKTAMDQGRHADGQTILRSAITLCGRSPAFASLQTTAMVSDLNTAMQQCSSHEMYERQGKYSMASKCQSHYQQRSNTSKFGGSEEVYRAMGSKKSAMRMKMKAQHDQHRSCSQQMQMQQQQQMPVPVQQQSPKRMSSAIFHGLSKLQRSLRGAGSPPPPPPPAAPSSSA